jgi:hypothetical protein
MRTDNSGNRYAPTTSYPRAAREFCERKRELLFPLQEVVAASDDFHASIGLVGAFAAV